jgi:hypothetical protein
MQENLTIRAGLTSGRQFGRQSRRVLNYAARILRDRPGKRGRKNIEGQVSRWGQATPGEFGVDRHEFENGECEKVLEMAAKYICNLLDGLCPMVVEKHPCPANCTLATLPWHCWIDYFQAGAAARKVQRKE